MVDATSDARHAALAVPSRRRLLEVLRRGGKPLDVTDLAAAVGLHVTTARSHLELLERAGLVHRAADRAGRPGRPRQLYAAAAQPVVGEGHRQLAGVLAAAVAGDDDGGRGRAERAGERWAEEQVPAGTVQSWDAATRGVGELFDRLGFAPQLVDDGRHRRLELYGCPFRDTARAYPDVVCGMHLGLLRGALTRLGGSADGVGLRAFVAPELCIADVPSPPRWEEEPCPEPVR